MGGDGRSGVRMHRRIQLWIRELKILLEVCFMVARLTKFRATFGIAITSFALALAGCQGPITQDEPTAQRSLAPLTGSPISWTPPADATPWPIDVTASYISLKVYRDGPLARLGHNHVIQGPISGTLFIAPNDLDSAIRLRIPTAKFIVDDPKSRQQAGTEFPPIPDVARQATRKNMLSEAVLNESRFADIEVYSVGLDGQNRNLVADLKVWIAGREAVVTVPFTVSQSKDRFEAAATFQLNHSDLGLTPFSVFGGALRVAETIEVTLRLVAAGP